MALVRWNNRGEKDLWNDFKSLQDEINDLFDFDRFPTSTGLFDRNVSPAVDVIEGSHDFTVICELPGIEQKDLDVSVTANVLTIKGEKKREENANNDRSGGKFYKRESWTGKFQRTLSLPESIDPDKISAQLKDGLLTMTIQKREEAKPKQISVKIK